MTVQTKSSYTRIWSNEVLYVLVFQNECKVYYLWSPIKTYGSKVMKKKEIPFAVILGRLFGDGEHKQIDLT